jgi:outer membrane PBP1 activator LpoA protein
MVSNFELAWLEQQGSIGAKAVYSDPSDYSSSIQAALKLGDSEQRGRQVRRFMDNRVEFSPRRREDVDSVFLFAGNPQEARSLKPLLAFHYAGDLPVYATSYVSSGNPDPQRDRDLNDIRLLEMPWSLKPNNLLRTKLEQLEYNDELTAMYALGADAFLLHWRLPQLRKSSNYSIRGNTGLLSMDAEGRVHRQLRPASIVSGIPVARAP